MEEVQGADTEEAVRDTDIVRDAVVKLARELRMALVDQDVLINRCDSFADDLYQTNQKIKALEEEMRALKLTKIQTETPRYKWEDESPDYVVPEITPMDERAIKKHEWITDELAPPPKWNKSKLKKTKQLKALQSWDPNGPHAAQELNAILKLNPS